MSEIGFLINFTQIMSLMMEKWQLENQYVFKIPMVLERLGGPPIPPHPPKMQKSRRMCPASTSGW